MKKALLHILIITAVCMGTTTHAYWWRFNNLTTKILLLKVKLLASNNPYYAIVHPNMSVLFDWSPPNFMAGFCFGGVQWMEAPDEILNNRNIVNRYHTVFNNRAMDKLFSGDEPLYELNNGTIEYFSNELYKKTVKAAKETFSFIKPVIKWGAKQYAETPCKSRNIIIQEDEDGIIHFLTPKS